MISFAEINGKELSDKQGDFLGKLQGDVNDFLKSVLEYNEDYYKNGPTIPGIEPMKAMIRLKEFK